MTFSLYSPEEIKSLSTCHVTQGESFNALFHPAAGGLYDLRMGPSTDRDNLMCATCMLTAEHCPGHIGHIELPLPVCNPMFYATILQLLKLSCIHCHRFRVPDLVKEVFLVRQKLLKAGLIIEAQQADQVCGDPAEIDASIDNVAAKPTKKMAAVAMLASVGRVDDDLQRLRNYCEEVLESNARPDDFGRPASPSAASTSSSSSSASSYSGMNTRSVEDLRRQYRKEFVKNGATQGVCQHCGTWTKSIKLYR